HLEVLEDRRPLGEMLLGALWVSAFFELDSLGFGTALTSGLARTAEVPQSVSIRLVRLGSATVAAEEQAPGRLSALESELGERTAGEPGRESAPAEPWGWEGAASQSDRHGLLDGSSLTRDPFAGLAPPSAGGGQVKASRREDPQTVRGSAPTEGVAPPGDHG